MIDPFGFGMGINQIRDGLRIAGTVEFAGLDAAPDYRRTEVMLRHTLHVMRDIGPVDETKVSHWMVFQWTPALRAVVVRLSFLTVLGNTSAGPHSTD